jgi:hypothetical protein
VCTSEGHFGKTYNLNGPDVLAFGRLWYGESDAMANAIALRQVLLPLKGHMSFSDRSKPPRTLTALKAPIERRWWHELCKRGRKL